MNSACSSPLLEQAKLSLSPLHIGLRRSNSNNGKHSHNQFQQQKSIFKFGTKKRVASENPFLASDGLPFNSPDSFTFPVICRKSSSTPLVLKENSSPDQISSDFDDKFSETRPLKNFGVMLG